MPPLDTILLLAGAVLGLAALVCAIFGWRGESGLLAIVDAPTRSAAEVVERHRWAQHGAAQLGEPVEVCGTIECDAAIQASFTGTRCIAFDCTATEERETHIGSMRPGRGYEIETHGYDAHDQRAPRFVVRDASGTVAVATAGAAIELLETMARYESYTGLRGSERELWREERALPVGHQVYVLGYLCDDGGQPLIARDPTGRGRRFLISHRSEVSLVRNLRRRAYSLYLAGGLSAGAAVALVVVAML